MHFDWLFLMIFWGLTHRWHWHEWLGFLFNKTSRFHSALCQVSKKPQMMAKCDKNIRDTIGWIFSANFFVFTTFWCHLWSFTTQKHGTMESIHWMENTTLPVGCYKVSWHLHMISNLAVSRNIQNFFASLLWCPIGDQVK